MCCRPRKATRLTCHEITGKPLQVVLPDPVQEGEQGLEVRKNLLSRGSELPEVLSSGRGLFNKGVCRVHRLAPCNLILVGLRLLELDIEEFGQPVADFCAHGGHLDVWRSEELVGKKVLSKSCRQQVRDGPVLLQQTTECGQVEDRTGRRRLWFISCSSRILLE